MNDIGACISSREHGAGHFCDSPCKQAGRKLGANIQIWGKHVSNKGQTSKHRANLQSWGKHVLNKGHSSKQRQTPTRAGPCSIPPGGTLNACRPLSTAANTTQRAVPDAAAAEGAIIMLPGPRSLATTSRLVALCVHAVGHPGAVGWWSELCRI